METSRSASKRLNALATSTLRGQGEIAKNTRRLPAIGRSVPRARGGLALRFSMVLAGIIVGFAANAVVPDTIAEASDLIFSNDFENPTIPWVRQHSEDLQGVSVTLQPATVLAEAQIGGSKFVLWLEVPGGYSPFNGIKASGPLGGVVPVRNDCVIVTGTIGEVYGATVLTDSTIVVESPDVCGDQLPVPLALDIHDIASDTDPLTPGYQPGTMADAYESMLVEVSFVRVVGVDYRGNLTVVAQSAPAADQLFIGTRIFDVPDYGIGTGFISITGVLDRQDQSTPTPQPVYTLLPRNESDLVGQ